MSAHPLGELLTPPAVGEMLAQLLPEGVQLPALRAQGWR